MKRFLKYASCLSFLLICFSFNSYNPAAEFEGVIVYNMNATTNKPASEKKMKDCSVTIYIKGSMCKMVTEKSGVTTINIIDSRKPNEVITLEEFLGKKYRVKPDPADKDDGPAPEISIKYTDSTKVIAGITCTKAIITKKSADYTDVFRVFYTDQVPPIPFYRGDFKDLKGCPLEYNRVITSNFGMHMVATSVTRQSLPDNTFTVPKDYKLMSSDDIVNDMQSNARRQ